MEFQSERERLQGDFFFREDLSLGRYFEFDICTQLDLGAFTFKLKLVLLRADATSEEKSVSHLNQDVLE
jgi:hypothetical protein